MIPPSAGQPRVGSYWQYPLALVALTLLSAAGRSFLQFHSFSLPLETGRLDTLVFNSILALWVRADRRSRMFSVPFEFDAFLFFSWPLLLPWYLYRTRGGRGLLHTAVIYALAILPHIAASIAYACSKV